MRDFTPLRRIETARLVLRFWHDDDLENFAAMNADPRVLEHFPSVLTRAQSDASAARIRAHLETHGYGLWAVERRDCPGFIGFAGLAHVSFEAPFTPGVEIGWRLAFEHWGNGYATEAASTAVSAGFEQIGLEEIFAFTTPANVRSRRVMEKLGFSRNPAEDFAHPALPAGHPLQRHVLYRLRRSSFRRGASLSAPT